MLELIRLQVTGSDIVVHAGQEETGARVTTSPANQLRGSHWAI
jgi:hypothetical protein